MPQDTPAVVRRASSALLLSPIKRTSPSSSVERFLWTTSESRGAPGTTTSFQYNHYSLLRSIEDGFGLAHLGYAAAPGLRSFGNDVFTAR